MQKLYCYVDETGQDPASEFFIVVAIVLQKEQESIRKKLDKYKAKELTNALRTRGISLRMIKSRRDES